MRKGIPAIGLFLVMAVILIIPVAKADGVEYDRNLPGKWVVKPMIDPEVEKDYALTKEESGVCREKMTRLIEIFKNNPVLSSPKGFNVKSYSRYIPPNDWYGQHKPPYTNLRIRMEYWASLPSLYHLGGKIHELMEPPYFKVTLNEPFTFINYWQLQYGGLWDEQGREIFLQPYSERDLDGVTVYERGYTVIVAKKGRPLWVPITQEHYLKTLIYNYQKKKQKKSDDEVACDMLIDLARERLNALSPEERRLTARYSSASEDPLGLCDSSDETAFVLVIFNPEYYNRALPRTAVQLIVIKYGYGGGFDYSEADSMEFVRTGTNQTLYDLERCLDYQAVARLLD